MKGLLFEQIMALDEEGIRKAFPKGAVQTKTRFKPARTKAEATKTLAKMLADKRKRMAPKRLLGKTHGYTENPAFAMFTKPDDPGEAVDEITQTEFSREANERFHGSHEEVGRTNPSLYLARRIKNRKAA